MGIKQLPNGSWEVSIYLPGNRRDRNRRWRRRYPTEDIAKAIDLKLQVAKLEGRVKEVLAELNRNQSSATLIRDLSELYLEQYVAVQNRHPQSKRNRVKLLVRELGHIPVSELTVFDVTAYISRKKRGGTGAATINRDISALKHMLGWALDQGLIANNPLRQLKKLREERKLPISDEHIPILEKAIQETLSNLPAECEPVFRFLYETGCRKEEAFSLKHPQVELAERVVVLPKTKAGRLRYIALTRAAIEAVNRMPKVSDYVFYNPKTLDRWFDCRKPWEAARKKAGYTWLKVKDMRTAFAIRLANMPGLEKHTIQTLLGHSSLSTTERFYAFHSHRLAVQRGLRLIEGKKNEKGAA